MQRRTRSTAVDGPDAERYQLPEMRVCESSPGKRVVLQSGNTDGWITSDRPIETGR